MWLCPIRGLANHAFEERHVFYFVEEGRRCRSNLTKYSRYSSLRKIALSLSGSISLSTAEVAGGRCQGIVDMATAGARSRGRMEEESGGGREAGYRRGQASRCSEPQAQRCLLGPRRRSGSSPFDGDSSVERGSDKGGEKATSTTKQPSPPSTSCPRSLLEGVSPHSPPTRWVQISARFKEDFFQAGH